MTRVGHGGISNACEAPCGWFRRSLARKLRRLSFAIPFVMVLATLGEPGPAFALSCTGTLSAAALTTCQTTDQEMLLAPFNDLLNSPAGLAALAANLQTEVSIYLNSTQAEKIAAGTILIPQYIPANLLLRAFPQNPNFDYTPAGLPNMPALPQSVTDATSDIYNNTQINGMKPYFGMVNAYGNAYGLLPGQIDSLGNPSPYQVSSAILNNPFTAANSSALAAAIQQNASSSTFGVGWADQGDSMIADFPSAHTLASTIDALTYAVLAPGNYQQFALGEADFAYDLNVYAAHYPLDVIGGRILATYVVAQTLANNPLYPSVTGIPGNLASLSQAMQGYLAAAGIAGGASSPYAAPCVASVAACVAGGVIPTAAQYAQAQQTYMYFLTYDLPSVSDTTLAPVVPADAYVLIATRFPYLSVAQLNQILATTELPSGGPVDNGTGWARLNLYAAAGGYGAFPTDVTVNMNAALGGLNAFDIWSNNITGPGGLALQGSGTLILAGTNSYTGGTTVQGGTLAVTGTLGGNLTVSPGASFVNNGGYAAAANATLVNAGTFIEVNTPLVDAGTTSNTGTIVGEVNNSGNFTNNGVVTGAFANSGLLSGNGVVGSLALLPGSTVTPGDAIGIIRVMGNLTVAAEATYQVQVGVNGADLIQVGGSATLSGGTVVVTGLGNTAALGHAAPILTAAGGVFGSFDAVTGLASGLAASTRVDALYGSNTVSLATTPSFYGDLAAVGVPESPREIRIGGIVDALRPPPGAPLNAAQSALFNSLYALPVGGIATGLDELVPSIYADEMITARNSWYLMADAVSGQLAARRGLAAGNTANSAAGPNGSTIWLSALAGYDTVGAGGGSPGFTAGLGGTAAGIDVPVGGTGRVGVAAGTVEGQTWSQSDGNASNTTAQFVTYGQWQSGMLFAAAQLGLMYQQEDVHRTVPLFGTSTRGDTNGLAGGGGVRAGVQQTLGAWLIEPSLGFGGFDLHMDHLTEAGGTAPAEAIAGTTLGGAESTLAVSAQRAFALSETVRVTARAQVGWSHELADNTTTLSASFAGLGGSGFALNSAPIGRDAAVVGLDADIKVAAWPVAMFVGYGGAISASSNMQSFNAGVRFAW